MRQRCGGGDVVIGIESEDMPRGSLSLCIIT